MKTLKKIFPIIFLFSLLIIQIEVVGENPNKSFDEHNLNITYYVDDDDQNIFQNIQAAIDNASDGDIIFVHSGIYYGNIVINKQLTIIGENKNSTIIDGMNAENPVHISSSFVNFQRFTVINGSNTLYGGGINIIDSYWWWANLPRIEVTNVTISDCIIENNGCGIRSSNSSNISIENCIIHNNFGQSIIFYDSSYINIEKCRIYNLENTNDNGSKGGIFLLIYDVFNKVSLDRSNVTIINCLIDNTDYGIYIEDIPDVTISHNIISNQTKYGIYIKNNIPWTLKTTITKNKIINNKYGIESIYYPGSPEELNLPDPSPPDELNIIKNHIETNYEGLIIIDNQIKANIQSNNFIDNLRNIEFILQIPSNHLFLPLWNNNYWSNHLGTGSKIIFGRLSKPYTMILIPWINFDLNPVKVPYNI